MRSGGLVTALIAIAACRATAGITSVDGMDVRVAFDDFKAQYGKTYGSAAEDARRFAIFEANLRAAADHNAQHEHDVFQSQGVNLFSDLTLEELRRSRTVLVTRADRARTFFRFVLRAARECAANFCKKTRD